MAISSVIASMQAHLSQAYDKANEKGATIPLAKNLANLASTIDSISAGGGDDTPKQVIEGTITSLTDSTITSVKAYGFANCYMLSEINLPNCSYIGGTAFYGCYSLKSLSLPNLISCSIEPFTTAVNVSNIELPKLVNAFRLLGGNLGVKEVSLPNCVLAQSAFTNCSNLTKAYMPNVYSAMSSTFANCSKLNDVTVVNCYGLGVSAFYSCKQLTSLSCYQPSYFGQNCFAECIKLSKIEIYGASGINTITSLQTNTFTNTPFVNSSITNGYQGWGSIYVPSYLLSKYQTNANWSNAGIASERFVGVNDEDLPVICPARYMSSTLTSIPLFEQSKVGVGAFAFYQCFNLTEVNLPNCECIGNYAFNPCRNISSLSIPKCKIIHMQAFYGCSSLSQLIGDEIKVISTQAFGFCINLTNIELPKCVALGQSAFYQATKLVSVSVPELVWLESATFQYCYSLPKISLPKVYWISGTSAFAGCSKLSQVIIGTSNCNLGNSNTFNNTPIANSTYLGYYGSIYVPSEYVNDYKTATNWVTYSDRITSIENLPSEE